MPMAASSAMMAEMVAAEVSPGTAIMSRPTEHTQVMASSLSRVRAPDWAAADGEDKDNLGLMYGEILAPLVQVVQDQQREIEELKARLSEMEASACGKSE